MAEFLGKYIKEKNDKSEELFLKEWLYRSINVDRDELNVGDILFFHQEETLSTAKALHLATIIGSDLGGMPWILHATAQYFKRPAVEIIPITAIFSNKQRNFYGARRLRQTADPIVSERVLTPARSYALDAE